LTYDLENLSAILRESPAMNICAKFHWYLSTK